MIKHEKKYFGTDGIRGVVGNDVMNQDIAYRLGQAMVVFCEENKLKTKIIIGRDTRWSASELELAVIAGVEKAGGEISLAGVITTPGLALFARDDNAGLSLMITASHNDYKYNGFKVFNRLGEKVNNEEENRIEELIDEAVGFDGREFIETIKVDGTYRKRYEDFLLKIFKKDDFSDLNIVLDCANGASFEIAPNIFNKITKKTKTLFNSPDGKNINENCGSQFPEIMAENVIKEKADIGLAFDGDGDRIIVVDERGKILTGDHILFILGKMLKLQGELRNDIIVSTVMSNIAFVRALEKENIKHKQTNVGDSVVSRGMKEAGAVLGGEEAGHILLLNYHSSGDGILSALMMLRALKFFKKPLSELAKCFIPYPKILKNIEVKSKPPLETLPELIELIKKIEGELGDEGRVLVRYSGTEKICRVMVEGVDEAQVEKYVDEIIDRIDKLLNC